MLLQPSPIRSNHFDYIPETKRFVAEISEIGANFQPGRVYDDAADVGFTMISTRTDKPAVFRHDHTHRDEGDVTFWEFNCVTPGLEDLSVVIFND